MARSSSVHRSVHCGQRPSFDIALPLRSIAKQVDCNATNIAPCAGCGNLTAYPARCTQNVPLRDKYATDLVNIPGTIAPFCKKTAR
jgi:hypothetical protein